MKIYNKTNQIQELHVYDRESHRQYSVYVCANSSTELEKNISSPELPKLVAKGIFEIVGSETVSTPKETVKEVVFPTAPVTPEPEVPSIVEVPKEKILEEVEIPKEVEVEVPEVKESSAFICDICGGEFASVRGLSAHKKKAHND